MANFFDLKARKQELAATNGSSSAKQDKQNVENARVQPWVEK
jgi:hypothetical protein